MTIKNLFSKKTEDEGWYVPQNDNLETSSVDPDRYFLILFLKSWQIYRTWIFKSDIDNFREKFQNSRDTIGIKKKFFQFGRHDEFDLTEIAWYQSRPYLVRDEASIDNP